MLKLCGDTEEKLAQELIVFELQMERDVVDPLYVLAEVNLALIETKLQRYFSVFQVLVVYDQLPWTIILTFSVLTKEDYL